MSQQHGFAPRPLGPRSLLWRYAGDHRLALVGFSAGLLQLMHPAIGAGVADHSSFFDEPWQRIGRSAPQIIGVVYDPDPQATGRRVRDYHRPITGVDHKGRRYRALAPETFWWAHATFQYAVERMVDGFDSHDLSAAEREELYLDGVEWYRRYGVSCRPVPPDYDGFCRKWERYCDEVLELTPAAERAIDMALHPGGQRLPFLPSWTAPWQRLTVTPLIRLTTIGGLPARVRRRMGIPWRLDEELQLRTLGLMVSQGWRFVPESLRYGPRAAAGRRAALSGTPAAGSAA